MIHSRRCTALLLAALFAGGSLASRPAGVAAGEIEKVQFADQQKIGDTTLALRRMGLVRYKLVIKAFVAALYLEANCEPAVALNDVPKRMEIEYLTEIRGADVVEAADKVLKDNLSPQEFEKLRKKIDELHRWYVDVKAGDRYSLTYIPGQGTSLIINGKAQGTVEGAEFAAAYFKIWLGSKPVDSSLKSQLLGQ